MSASVRRLASTSRRSVARTYDPRSSSQPCSSMNARISPAAFDQRSPRFGTNPSSASFRARSSATQPIASEVAVLGRVKPDRVHDVAVEIELDLLGRQVPDPDRTRAPVAVERGESLLPGLGAPIHPVENLEARRAQPGRMHEPPEKGMRLVLVAERLEGVEGVRRVSQPREAVVPVPLARNPFGQ